MARRRGEPIATKRPERKLIADIQRSEPEPEPTVELNIPPTAAERAAKGKRQPAEV